MWQSNSSVYITFTKTSIVVILFLLPIFANAGLFDWSDVDFGTLPKQQAQEEEKVVGELLTKNIQDNENNNNLDINNENENKEKREETGQKVLGVQNTSKDPTDAVEVVRLYLDEATITKGYTITSSQNDLQVGVVNNAVTVPVEVVLKDIPATHHASNKKTFQKISKILEYDIRHQVPGGTESLGILEKPIFVAIAYSDTSIQKKVLHYWNKPTQEWVRLSSTTDFDNQLVRAQINFPYARLAVFNATDVYEGPASWYAFKDCHCAASNVYMRSTTLQVTNIEKTSPKYGSTLTVRVNDYGPDPVIHPDRSIDLDKHAFSHLASSLGSGLMLVRVEPVDLSNAEKYSWVIEEEEKRLVASNKGVQ